MKKFKLTLIFVPVLLCGQETVAPTTDREYGPVVESGEITTNNSLSLELTRS